MSSSGNVARADSVSTSPAYNPARSGATAMSVASSPRRRRNRPPSVSSTPSFRFPRNRSMAARRRPARDTPGQRNTSPMSPGIPNGASLGNGDQSAIGPEVGTLRARGHQLAGQAELPAEVDRPRLASDERIGPRLEPQVAHLRRPELAAGSIGRLVNGDVDPGRGQPVRGRQAGDPAPDDVDATRKAHLAGTSARCSRTTAASTSRYAGSAFGIRVRSNRVPARSAIAAGLDVQVVQDLQVVGHEPGRAHDHGISTGGRQLLDHRLRSAVPTTGRRFGRRSATR